jgi:hypothetical protein
MTTLSALVQSELSLSVREEVLMAARQLVTLHRGDAVLFYGSTLHTRDFDGILDFYVLQNRAVGQRSELVWPRVSYHEIQIKGRMVRAKVATMSLAKFTHAARGAGLDTTIWTRFSQPSRLVLSASPIVTTQITNAVCDCVRTATQFAAVLGPGWGSSNDYWRALFQQTYKTEFRIEKASRTDVILARDPRYYSDALLAAWREMGIIDQPSGTVLHPMINKQLSAFLKSRWRKHWAVGKPLNFIRLLKAAWTFENGARYALSKIERHNGISLKLTPWRERHPVLAAPAVLFHLWRAGQR